ncbi:MAG: hypothetical protein OXT67_05650 [Zetaproteobacteria bacterium]|nr:hypothetical protein [Zetaproteobacteria bacterium]
MSHHKRQRYFYNLGAILLTWHLQVGDTPAPALVYPTPAETLALATTQTLPATPPTPAPTKMAQLGRRLFFDPQFSSNQQVSCATCHQPEHGYTDTYPTAHGIGVGHRRTPSIAMVQHQNWFFWDGRADSLEAQALGPIEHPLEHGFSRVALVKALYHSYAQEMQDIFGPWPLTAHEIATLPAHAAPTPSPEFLPTTVATYTLASLNDFWAQDTILTQAAKRQLSPGNLVSLYSDPRPTLPPAWTQAWERIPPTQQEAIHTIALQFGKAVATFERGLHIQPGKFDRAVDTLTQPQLDSSPLNAEELHGMKVFFGPGQCHLCHSGPLFTDGQFHNIGLPRHPQSRESSLSLDVGRSMGLVLAQKATFRCSNTTHPLLDPTTETCQELAWADPNSLELVGAFKTPSLRGVSERKYFMHDGRFSHLEEVIDYYNTLEEGLSLGHREETLRPLQLTTTDKQALIQFLHTLSSPVIDSTKASQATTSLQHAPASHSNGTEQG